MEEAHTIIISAAKFFVSMALGGFLLLFLWLFDDLVLRSKRLRSKLEKQGVKGPRPSILYGNITEIKNLAQLKKRNSLEKYYSEENPLHCWLPAVFPHLEQWRNQYGPVFLYSTGNIQILCITEPELVKEFSLCISMDLGKPSYLSTERGPLLGRGILSSNGPYWAHQRKIIAPEFYMDKVKGMVTLMVESTLVMLKKWENKIEMDGKAEIRVDEDLRNLSADIISRACFGSSHVEGEKIFTKLQELQKIMSRGHIGVPGSRYIPNKFNKEIWKLEGEIDSMILEIVKSRSDDSCRKDLLQLILNAAENYGDDGNIPDDITPNKFIVDNCKNIYFAGHETTATAASWCLMALASYPEWQARARDEVLQICGKCIPNADMLRNMKVLTMVIQETLRLYPPVAFGVREALQDIKLKDIRVPKGMNIQVPVSIMHQLEELWGHDTHQFKPDRFDNGIAGACKIPQAYMPFGMGPRICVGQHFAMTELKVFLSLILIKFRISLSPAYRHSPAFRLVIQPEYGVLVYLEKL